MKQCELKFNKVARIYFIIHFHNITRVALCKSQPTMIIIKIVIRRNGSNWVVEIEYATNFQVLGFVFEFWLLILCSNPKFVGPFLGRVNNDGFNIQSK